MSHNQVLNYPSKTLNHSGIHYGDYGEYDSDDTTDSSDSSDLIPISRDLMSNALLMTALQKMEVVKTVWDKRRADADKTADEIVKEEEKLKQKRQRKSEKKKRQKERKKMEKQEETASNNHDESSEDSSEESFENQETITKTAAKENKPSPVKHKENGAKRKKKGRGDREGAEVLDTSSAFVSKFMGKLGDSVAQTGAKPKKKNGTDAEDSCSVASTLSSPGGVSTKPAVIEKQTKDDKVHKSRELAVLGNNFASDNRFLDAAVAFTKAIQLNSTDCRFYGNRSYCFDRLEAYDKALSDAERAVQLDPDWPKGHYRKGKALFGLKKFAEAEQSFQRVLKLDKHCQEAVCEIYNIRLQLLMEWGFPMAQAERALRKHACIETALEALLAGTVSEDDDSPEDEIFVSDDEEAVAAPKPQPKPKPPPPRPNVTVKTQPTALQKQSVPHNGKTKSLWIGNLQQSVKDSQINDLFSKFGRIVCIKRPADSFYAFVNYETEAAASKAMDKMQGFELAGYNLKIKYPGKENKDEDNTQLKKSQPAPTNGTKTLTTQNGTASIGTKPAITASTGTKPATTASKPAKTASTGTKPATNTAAVKSFAQFVSSLVDPAKTTQPAKPSSNGILPTPKPLLSKPTPATSLGAPLKYDPKIKAEKKRGPVNGDECYFWRTTGCRYGPACLNRHVPSHKGVDRTGWMKQDSGI